MAALFRRVLFGAKVEALLKCFKPAVIYSGSILRNHSSKLNFKETRTILYNSCLKNINALQLSNKSSSQNYDKRWHWLMVAGIGFVAGSGDYPPDQVKKFIKSCQRGNSAEVQRHLKNGGTLYWGVRCIIVLQTQ